MQFEVVADMVIIRSERNIQFSRAIFEVNPLLEIRGDVQSQILRMFLKIFQEPFSGKFRQVIIAHRGHQF